MDTDELVRYADEAREAVRVLNHGTRRTIPAPLAYDLLGSLQALAYGLPQLVGQIGAGLTRSLDEYDVYDRNRAPARSVAMAREALGLAANHARRIGDLLAAAQLAINLQGYNEEDDR